MYWKRPAHGPSAFPGRSVHEQYATQSERFEEAEEQKHNGAFMAVQSFLLSLQGIRPTILAEKYAARHIHETIFWVKIV